jgi:allantoin racemase
MQPTTAPLKNLLIINPNTTVSVTLHLQALAMQALGQHARTEAVTVPFGAPYISTEVDCAIASHATLQAWQDWQNGSGVQADGVLIGCFGDPGLFALREMTRVPVTGLAQASFIEAQTHGHYAIVTGGKAWEPMLTRLARALPAGQNLVDIETVELDGGRLRANPALGEQMLTEACQRVLARSKVQAIIIGGAGLAGFAHRIQPQVSALLIDSVDAGLRHLDAISGPTALCST